MTVAWRKQTEVTPIIMLQCGNNNDVYIVTEQRTP